MPISSPGDLPAQTVRELGLPARAVTALTRAGVTTVEELAALTRRELAAVDGLGPGMIAAIRGVVPEPPSSLTRPGTRDREADEEAPAPPVMPSFDSLRAPRGRSAIDVLVPGPAPAPPADEPASPASPAGGGAPGGPRPAEYADLWRFGARVLCGAMGVPGRVLRWSVREPVRQVRRLFGA
jgi:Bacterial RNA polymerase, alpha chain C terminal domain